MNTSTLPTGFAPEAEASPDAQEFFGFFHSTSAVSNNPPVITNLNGDSVAWAGVGSTVGLDDGSNATATDVELGNGNWTGASLTVQRAGTAVGTDVYGFDTSAGTPQFTVDTANGLLLDTSANAFASYTHIGGVLSIQFDSSAAGASRDLVNEVLGRVTYRNDTPGGDATVQFSLNDGMSATTANVTVTSNTIYVTSATDTAVNNPSDGVSLSEALVLAAGGGKTIVFASSLAGSTINLAGNANVAGNTTFEMAGSGTITITGNEMVFGGQLTVAAGTGGRLVVDSKVSGSIEKTGAGALELGGTGNTTGTVNVASGELVVKNGSALSDGSAVTVALGAKLSLAGSETIGSLAGAGALGLGAGTQLTIGDGTSTTFTGAITGSGGLIKTGAGSLTLLSDTGNTFSGGVDIQAGTLAIANGQSISAGNAVNVAGSATLAVTQGSITIGSLTGAGNVVLTNTLRTGGDGTSTTFSGVISSTNTSGIVKNGAGTFTLTGDNTYTGSTTVSAGTLKVDRAGGAIADTSAVTVASGASLDLGSSAETLGSLAGAGTVNLGASGLTVGNSNNTTFSGALTGSGQLAKTGTGSFTISGTDPSTYSGNIIVSDGTLIAGSNNALGTTAGTTTVNGGATLQVANGATVADALTVGGSGQGNLGALVFSGATGTVSGNVNLTTGTYFGATGSGAITGNISSSFFLAKVGAGTLTFSGNNTLSSTTFVTNGTLLVNGIQSNSGAIAVSSGATLGGSGYINGNVTVDSGGTVAPGASAGAVGVLTFNGNLLLSSGSTLAVNVNGTAAGTQYDQVAAEGAVTITGAILAATVGYTPAAGDIYALINNYNNAAIVGTFTGLAEAGTLTANATALKGSYIGGDGNEFTLVAMAPPTVDTGGDTPPPAPATIDGVPVVTVPGSNGTTITTIPLVQPNRPDTPGTPNPTLADVPLAKDSSGQSLLQVGVPTGMGLKAEGLPGSATPAAVQADLTQRIDGLAGVGSDLAVQAQAFLATLGTGAPLTVQTLTPTTGVGFNPDVPLVITGGSGNQAIVIDARALPSGTVIQVDNVEFVAIVGAVRVIGGAGQNTASGDGAAQWIVLGPDDDIIHGGGGNDTVGSEGGDDQVYGDAGDDIVFGGAGNDLLSGGTGSDRLNGGTGFDVAIQEGKKTDYTVTLEAGGIKLTHIATGISDWLVDVEQVRFETGPMLTVAHSAAEEAGAYLFQKWIGRDLTQAEGAVIQTLTGKTALEVATLFAQAFPQQSAGKTPAQLLEGMDSAGAIRVDAVRDVTVTGDGGNNTIAPTLGLARYVDGGAGIDTLVIPATLAQTHVQTSGSSGTLTLQRLTDGSMLDVTHVERITFNDTKLALDLNGHAGDAARLLGALGGTAILANKGMVGEVIRALDAGATSQTLAGIGLQLLGAQTPVQVAQLLWTNLVGRAGTQAELKPLVDLMASGVSFNEVAVMAAHLELTAARIDLVGLTAKGIEFA